MIISPLYGACHHPKTSKKHPFFRKLFSTHLCREWQQLATVFLVVCSLFSSNTLYGQYAVEVLAGQGTGRTTGHIIDLTVSNRTDQRQTVEPATYFVPSEGQFQSYVARLVDTLQLAPGQTLTVPLLGYCADVTRPALPNGKYTTPFKDWVMVRPNEIGLVDRNFFVPDNVVDPWKIGFVPRTVRFNWNNIPANAPHPTWPGTTSSTNATISEDVPAVEFGAIVVAILEEIERSTYLHQTLRMIETPYSRVLPIENALLNQYAFWRTMAVWRGDNYAGKYFRTAVENQTGLTFPEINGKEEFRLNGEAVDLWLATENIMVNAGVVAPLAGKRYSSVRLLTEMGADPCEQSALRYIDLRYACLASCRGKLDALVTVQREVTALEFADSLSPADSLLLQSKRTELITARTALSQCEGETLPFCSIVEDYAEERGCSVEVARWAETGSQIDRPWDQLKLLHPSMKITAEEAALAHNAKDNIAGDLTKKKFPIWIPIAGAAAIGGGIIILTDGDSTPPDSMPPPELQVLNDAYILECGMSGIISPLDNDTGEEL
ncbi:MAG: hypothetical protein AAFU03_06575, partial [Bacteroidota bacterium]